MLEAWVRPEGRLVTRRGVSELLHTVVVLEQPDPDVVVDLPSLTYGASVQRVDLTESLLSPLSVLVSDFLSPRLRWGSRMAMAQRMDDLHLLVTPFPSVVVVLVPPVRDVAVDLPAWLLGANGQNSRLARSSCLPPPFMV